LGKRQGNRKKGYRVSGGGEGAESMVSNFFTDCHSGTNTKGSEIGFAVTYIALTLKRLDTKLLGLLAESLVETSGALSPRRILEKIN